MAPPDSPTWPSEFGHIQGTDFLNQATIWHILLLLI